MHSLVQSIKNLNVRIRDLLADQLSNPITFLHHEILFGMVEHYHTNITPVILVHHSSPDINVVLPCQTRSRSYSPISPMRNLHLDIRLDQPFPTSRYSSVLSTVQVISSCTGTASGRDDSMLRELRHLQQVHRLLLLYRGGDGGGHGQDLL